MKNFCNKIHERFPEYWKKWKHIYAKVYEPKEGAQEIECKLAEGGFYRTIKLIL